MEIIESKENEKAPSGTISISDGTEEVNTTKDSIESESVLEMSAEIPLLEISRDVPEVPKDKHNDSTETEPAVDNSMVMEDDNDEDDEESSEKDKEEKAEETTNHVSSEDKETEKEHDKSFDSTRTDTTNESVKSNNETSSVNGATSTSGSTCGSQSGASNAAPSECDSGESGE